MFSIGGNDPPEPVFQIIGRISEKLKTMGIGLEDIVAGYLVVKNFSTEEITDELSYSRKRARKNLDMIVEKFFTLLYAMQFTRRI